MGVLKRMGDWKKKVGDWIEEAHDELVTQVVGPLEDVGKAIKEEVRVGIATRKIEGPALAPSTKAAKGHGHPLIESREYFKSIDHGEVVVKRRLLGARLSVTVQPQGEQNQIKGVVHEYGNAHTPARPHWRPALESVKKRPELKAFLEGKWFKPKLKVR